MDRIKRQMILGVIFLSQTVFLTSMILHLRDYNLVEKVLNESFSFETVEAFFVLCGKIAKAPFLVTQEACFSWLSRKSMSLDSSVKIRVSKTL